MLVLGFIHTMDATQRLEQLVDALCMGFSLTAELPEDDRPSFEELVPGHPLNSAINQMDEWQPQQQTTKPTEGPDAPRKFLTHDAGPRACTQGAFDNSRFRPGQPLDGDTEFCPWVVVQKYPKNYVGNTNRPHVCHVTLLSDFCAKLTRP